MSDNKWAMPSSTPDEEERRRQIAAARRMGNTSGTGMVSKTPPQERQTTKMTRVSYRGHEALVDALRAAETVVHFDMCSGKEFEGVITHFDAATITIKKTGAEIGSVLFKHDISSITPKTLRIKGENQ